MSIAKMSCIGKTGNNFTLVKFFRSIFLHLFEKSRGNLQIYILKFFLEGFFLIEIDLLIMLLSSIRKICFCNRSYQTFAAFRVIRLPINRFRLNKNYVVLREYFLVEYWKVNQKNRCFMHRQTMHHFEIFFLRNKIFF